METRLLARVLATAKTVTALGAVSATRELGSDHSQSVRAQVAARLADGTFRVLVDGKPVRLALPGTVEPGDVIELRVVHRDGAARYQLAGTTAEPGGELSGTARLISTLLSEASAPAPRQIRPILELPPAASTDLPEPLARAVERSGLFYESHQARWVDGDYPLEQLLQEPQAQLPLPGAASPDEAPDAAASQLRAEALALSQAEGNGDETQQLVAREALPFVRSQLDALDARQITWLGEIWPGQPLSWEIGVDERAARGEEDEPGWSTGFALVLPALGEVAADLSLRAGGVRLHLKARGEATAEHLRTAAPELSQALAAVLQGPVHVQVSQDGGAG